MSGQNSTQNEDVVKICIMRHGMAESAASSDRVRRLVEFGEQQSHDTSIWFTKLFPNIEFDLAIVSPYVRAEQTFNIVTQHVSSKDTIVSEMITPESNAVQTHDYLIGLLSVETSSINSLLIVSHMPFVSLLLSELLENGRSDIFNTGSMAVVECPKSSLKGTLLHHYQSLY